MTSIKCLLNQGKLTLFFCFYYDTDEWYMILLNLSALQHSICEDIISMHIFISEFSNRYSFSWFPFVYRWNTSFFRVPVPIYQKGVMTVWLLSNFDLLFVLIVVNSLWILGVINAWHSMRMPFFNQTTHPLFFIAVHLLKRKLFVSQRKWISLHKF